MIVIELKGGLGNQMFQYALGRHLAIKHNCDFYLDCGYLLDRRFKSPSYTYRDYNLNIFDLSPLFASEGTSKKYGLLRPKHIRLAEFIFNPGTLQRLVEKQYAFDPSILEFSNNIYLTGYWQSEKYFMDIADQVRKDFNIVIDLESGSSTFEWSQMLSLENSVCVHVRKTDYVNNSLLDVLDKNYYQRAEQQLLKTVGKMTAYVFSDDIEWCKQYVKLQSKTVFVSSGQSKEGLKNDLYLMSRCKHFIIPNSTFSWWAAWLCDHKEKQVVCPKQWFNSARPFYEKETIVPERWVQI